MSPFWSTWTPDGQVAMHEAIDHDARMADELARGLAVCIRCTLTGRELCAHHHSTSACTPDWYVSNRIMCDFLHRGVAPKRLPLAERTSGLVLTLEEV